MESAEHTLTMQTTKPSIRFITAPATMTIMRCHTGLLRKSSGSSLSKSSPSCTAPPIGSSLNDHVVVLVVLLKILGPMPMENS